MAFVISTVIEISSIWSFVLPSNILVRVLTEYYSLNSIQLNLLIMNFFFLILFSIACWLNSGEFLSVRLNQTNGN